MPENQKIRINMLSAAQSVPGQGVGSAYAELVRLIQEYGQDCIELSINRGIRYDILHAVTVEPRNYLKFMFARCPRVMHVHFMPDTLDGSVHLPSLAFRVFKKYVIRFYKKADLLVVVNPSLIPAMTAAGLDERKIRYIPNFVSKQHFYPLSPTEKAAARDTRQLSEEDFVVLGAGQMQTRKGISDFIETAKSLPDMKFIWAGGFSFGAITDGYDRIRELMRNAPKNVIFTGIVSREEMNQLYNIADVYFSPSYNELFPMTVLESASCGTPILLRDLELYRPILDGRYLCGKNNEDFKKDLTKLKQDRLFYQSMVLAAEKIAEEYSEENVWRQWKDLYEDICCHKGKEK